MLPWWWDGGTTTTTTSPSRRSWWKNESSHCCRVTMYEKANFVDVYSSTAGWKYQPACIMHSNIGAHCKYPRAEGKDEWLLLKKQFLLRLFASDLLESRVLQIFFFFSPLFFIFFCFTVITEKVKHILNKDGERRCALALFAVPQVRISFAAFHEKRNPSIETRHHFSQTFFWHKKIRRISTFSLSFHTWCCRNDKYPKHLSANFRQVRSQSAWYMSWNVVCQQEILYKIAIFQFIKNRANSFFF